MNASELRALDEAELDARIRELRDGYFQLRIRRETGQLENLTQVATTRRELARALTIQNEKRRAR